MTKLIALGYGWGDYKDGVRLCKSDFSIKILDPTVVIESLYFTCSDLNPDYTIAILTNGWMVNTQNKVVHGDNVLNIPDNSNNNNKSPEVEIRVHNNKTDLVNANIQFTKIIIKQNVVITEIKLADIPLFSEMPSLEHDVNELKKHITLGSGWHNLECDEWRWSNGNGEIHITNGEYRSMQLQVKSNTSQLITIETNKDAATSSNIERIFTGNTLVKILLTGTGICTIKSDVFIPSDVDKTSGDIRKLGIQLLEVTLYGVSGSVKKIPVKFLSLD